MIVPRIPYIDPPAGHELADKIRTRRAGGRLLNLDRMLLNSPPYAQGWNTLLGAVRRDLKVSGKLRELVICAVAKLNDAPYEWLQHAPEYIAAGGSELQLQALDDVTAAASNEFLFDAAERAALHLTLEMTRHIRVSDRTFEAVRACLDEQDTVELVGTVAAYNMVSRFLVALGIGPEGE